ncbi:hypothetical protein SAMN05444362_101110 [Dysgonomonas macrotermitis]|uniref:Uncharacterized protein n=1 Tax=Dysgonomonas macrotermitis TaxID=1346286 RepID=A0A1M4SNI4_9BACT|nr:hypothetical protein SAMN05444362_101110 [Dysgonomonas macrotermitis]
MDTKLVSSTQIELSDFAKIRWKRNNNLNKSQEKEIP